MGRVSLSSAFAVTSGRRIDAAGCCRMTAPGTAGVRLVLAVEPMTPSPRGREVASAALDALEDAFWSQPEIDLPNRLRAGFAAANALLLAENRTTGCRSHHPVLAGAVVVAIDGRDLVAGLMAPSQFIVVQDRRLYAVPALSAWGGDWTPDSDAIGVEAGPLGLADHPAPAIVRTRVAAGDLLVVCHSSVAAAAARFPASGALLSTALAAADPAAATAAIENIARERDLDDAFAAALRLGPPPRRYRPAPWRFAEFRTPTPMPASTNGIGPSPARSEPSGRIARPAARQVADRRLTGGAATLHMAADPFEAFRLAVVEAAEAILPTTPVGARSAVESLRQAPGSGCINRYGAGRRVSAAARPRGAGWTVRLPVRLLGAAVLAAVLGGGAITADAVRHQRMERAAAALAVVDRATADLRADPVAPMLPIADAEAALAVAAAGGADPERLAVTLGAFAEARDEALGIQRLSNMAPVGSLPEDVDPDRAVLVTLGSRVFLAGGGFYEVDARRGFLVELLAPGQIVDGERVAPIVDAAVDGAGVLLSDGAALYRQDERGAWTRLRLVEPRMPGGPADGPAASFNRTLYAVAAGGSIVKYENDGSGLAPWMWASVGDYPDLTDAQDIAIDERVHVLLADGRVLSFYRGVLEMAGAPPVVPEAGGAGFFASAPGSAALYLVDTTALVGDSAGRLIRYDPGGRTQQFLAPIASPGSAEGQRTAHLLAGTTSVAVVEGAASVYLLVGNEIWRATMPPVTD